MNREFLKSEFYNPDNNKPVEFEIRDYDEALKLKSPSDIPPAVPPPSREPEIKQEPTTEDTPTITEIPETIPTPAPTTSKSSKGSRELKNLGSGLDGKAWGCSGTHGRRLIVRTTKINEEEEYSEHWNNTRDIEDKTLTSPICDV